MRHASPSVWVQNRATEWWESVIPIFTKAQWIKYFRMPKDTFLYLCHRLQPQLGRHDTNYRYCVPIQKIIASALSKFATNSHYRSISHLFVVGAATVCHRTLFLLICWEGTHVRSYSVTKQWKVKRNGKVFWTQMGVATVCRCNGWITHPHSWTRGIPHGVL